ncbi:hypothetical protein [Ornithinimicrobium cryptoxanthini]|uniref:Uncharacterized protein n=1 Tax=Ornithinimicrobium cryptoxanthini TaxID=2934161 RepID=A0ABY4YHG1_9MICO|nr:hypothetical protein [Ornithinimicrobium cryptoxanthini]USQ76211.1 hypothetical protein NF557_16735 [Ornithinimicrobium cryptoxanthini]
MDQLTRQVSVPARAARLAACSLLGAALVVGLSACSDAGDLQIVNEGPGGFTVLTGDENVTIETEAEAGVVILDYGCTPGDVTVRFAAGHEVVLAGPVCPDTAIVVGDGTARLRPAGE